MLANHHAFIDFHAGGDEEYSTILQPVECVGGGGAVAVGNEGTAWTLGNLALIRHVTVKERIHHDGAAGLGQHFAAQADEAAAGYPEFQTHAAVAVVMHL